MTDFDAELRAEMRRPVNLDQAAELVHVSPSTVRRWVATGILPAFWWRGRWYVRTEAVIDADLAQRRKAARRAGGDRRATPTPRVFDSEAMHTAKSGWDQV